jgi:hypothetical protein
VGAALLVAVALGLFAMRGWLLTRATRRGTDVEPMVTTWGCGYAWPTSRMQYTASSFASSLVTAFRNLLWPERTLMAPAGSFPSAAHLETVAPDMAEHELFEPVFRGAARMFANVRTVSWGGEYGSSDAASSGPARGRGPVRVLVAGMVSALRRGSIQIRLFFIVLTLVLLFLVEAMSSPGRADPTIRHDIQQTHTMGVDR